MKFRWNHAAPSGVATVLGATGRQPPQWGSAAAAHLQTPVRLHMQFSPQVHPHPPAFPLVNDSCRHVDQLHIICVSRQRRKIFIQEFAATTQSLGAGCTLSACARSRMREFRQCRFRRAAKWAGVRPSAAEAVNQVQGLHLHACSSLSARLSSGAMAARCRGVSPELSFTSACKPAKRR